ncbi:MAG: transglutaminase-like domain-containing protein [Gemmataceae bacterium]
MRNVFFLLLVLAPAALLQAEEKLSRPALDAKTIESTFAVDWYGVYLKDESSGKDKKIGYFMSKRERADKAVHDSFLMTMKIASFGKKVEMVISQDLFFEVEAPYRLLRGEFSQSSGPVKTRTLLERNGKGFRVTQSSAGMDVKRDLPEIDFDLADAMASEIWLRQGPKEGDTITFRDFSMEDLKVETQKTTLLTRKKSLVAGVEAVFYEVESIGSRNKLKMKTLHDDQGRLLSGKIAIFDLRRETEAQAKNTEYSADLFVLGQVKVDRPLGRTQSLEELVVEVLGKGGEVIPDGPRQTVEVKDGKRVLRIGKRYGKVVKATDKDIKEALEETTALPITHPKIVALAKEAVGDADTPAEKVKRICNFTYKYIRPSLTTSPPEIHHLIERKSGDCKCYARMFCVLARASGIPAREVSGFVYMGDDVKAFGGHAWDEALLDGVWVPLDASLNRTEVTAGHVYLGTDRDAAGILETMGRVQFRLVEKKSK